MVASCGKSCALFLFGKLKCVASRDCLARVGRAFNPVTGRFFWVTNVVPGANALFHQRIPLTVLRNFC